MSDSGSVRVSNILESSDAFRRGLRYDDEIVSFGGRSIDTPNAFKNVLGIYPKGWRVPLVFRQDGKEHSVIVRLTGVHAEEELLQLITRRVAPEDEPPEGRRPRPGRPDQPRRPGEQPPDGERRPDGQEPQPGPHLPGLHPKKDVEVPPEVQKLIQPRTGFANYYFNELNRDRIWSTFSNQSDYTTATGPWKLTGELAAGGNLEITLSDDASSGSFPQGTVKLDASQDLDQELGPRGSGGLLAALHLWRRMLVLGPQKFGDVIYYGTAPYSGADGLSEVLVATQNVAEVHLAFDSNSGRLATLEMITDPTSDGCELRFSDYRDVGGRQVPHRIDVHYGDVLYGQIEWKQIELASSSEEKKP
jgi:serine protease Do